MVKKMINIFTRFLLIPYLILCFSLLSTSSVFAFTVGEEREVGEKLLYAVRSSFEVLDEPDLHQYIDKLGKEVIDAAGVQFFDYYFFIIKNKEYNAFAAPSGLIFFHSGLIEAMDSEDELVSVLAHEIGHVVKRHIASRLAKGKKVTLTTLALVLASLALGGGAATEALFTGAIAAGQSANLHFSRRDEEEADLLAYGWMKKLHRSPHGQEKMLQTMRQIARYRSVKVPQYLLTHPNPEARLDYVQSLIASEKEEIESLKESDNFEFIRFKYRIMCQVKESIYLRGYFSSIIASNKTSEQDKIMAKYGYAQLERKDNNYVHSRELMDEVLDYYGDKNILYVDKGIIEYESGNVGKSYITLSKAYDSDRSNMYAAFALAKVCFNLGMIEKAENLFKSVMYEMPEFSRVYYELGRLSARNGNSGNTSYYLGKYYLNEGRLGISGEHLTTATKSDNTSEELKLDAKRSLDLIERIKK